MIWNLPGTIFALSGVVSSVREASDRNRQLARTASGSGSVPVTCPIERQTTGNHGQSQTRVSTGRLH